MEFIKANLVSFIVACVIMLGALIGVIVGIVTKGRWADKGLMVANGVKLRWEWSQFPLRVLTPPATPDDVKLAYDKAVAHINEVCGRTLFYDLETMPHGYSPTIAIEGSVNFVAHLASGELQQDHGETNLNFDQKTGSIQSCVVSVPASVPEIEPIVLHEMMHVLGFDHDEQRESIMFPAIQRRPQTLTGGDAKLLRKLYGPR